MTLSLRVLAAVVLAGALVLEVPGTLASAAEQGSSKNQPFVATAQYGRAIFEFYCASCHGREGRGGGPMMSVLKVPPPDLTLITRRYGGVFPADVVKSLLQDGRRGWPLAHGSREMPIWGPILRGDNTSETDGRFASLLAYLRSIQQ